MAVLRGNGAREDFANVVDNSIGSCAELADDLELWRNARGIVTE